MSVEQSRRQALRRVLLAPVTVLLVALVVIALVVNRDRLGVDLAGGRILPVPGLGAMWREYFASWHAVAGGTGTQPPAVLAVLGIVGAPFWSIGGPALAVSLLLILDIPLAGLFAYAASRRMSVPRWARALVAAGYALLPAATAAVAQGRIDAVAVHVLLPLALAGLGSVMFPKARIAGRSSWLPATTLCALAFAVLGAFSPLVYLLLVVLALAGFVVLPGVAGDGRRRIGSLFVLVLLPLALLLPWPAVLLQHPAAILNGVGATLAPQSASAGGLVTLDPGGAGSWPLIGVLVLLAGLVALVLRPRTALVPGVVVLVFGAIGVALVKLFPVAPLTGGAPQQGWPGAPLLLASAGLLAMVLTACAPVQRTATHTSRTVPGSRTLPRRAVAALAFGGSFVVVVLAVSGMTAGAGGVVHPGAGTRLAAAERDQLAASRMSVLVVGTGSQPTRQRGSREPGFGDDDFAPVAQVADRLAGWSQQLTGGDGSGVTSVLGQAAAAGVAYVVLPDRATADRVQQLAGGLVDPVPPTSDGRPVLRVRAGTGSVNLIAPTLARQAVTGGEPPAAPEPGSVIGVPAAPPSVAVRVSEGSRGRLLVLGAEYEAGWQASIDGRQAPLTEAWGHLVSVSVPENVARVEVTYSSTLRSVLLLCEAAAVLFTVLGSIPLRRE